MADPERLACHVIGVRLGKTIAEVEAMPVAELVGWLAFFELEADRLKNA